MDKTIAGEAHNVASLLNSRRQSSFNKDSDVVVEVFPAALDKARS